MVPLQSTMDGTSSDVIAGLIAVLFPHATSLLDSTYGHGNFYRKLPATISRTTFADMNPDRARDYVGDCRALPFQSSAFDVVVFDPPFQPNSKHTSTKIGARYGKVGPEHGGSMHNLAELKSLVLAGGQEARRVSRLGWIIKLQDYIHARRVVWMSQWCIEAFGEPFDAVNLRQPAKLVSSRWRHQLSVRRNHSTFLVWSHQGPYHVQR